MLTCDECPLWTSIICAKLSSDLRRIFRTSKSGSDFFRLVSLTDCANAYSSVLAIHPKSSCKLTKANLCFIRDSMSNGILSFVDADANLPDTLTKMHGNVKIFGKFRTSGHFSISFLGREGAKVLKRLKEQSVNNSFS